MSASLSAKFLADLAQVYATLRPPALSAAFLSDLEQVYGTLPVASEANLRFLAERFDAWRRLTQEFLRKRLAELPDDDPLKCPISLFRTMDAGRLEVAHTHTLAWLLDPNGEHGFKTALLAALLRRLIGHDAPAFQVERVWGEYPIDGSGAKGRLDVLVKGTWEDAERCGWVLIIEAKVDAEEGEDQLQKYETWLRANAFGRDVFLIFLTPDGRAPETATEEWEALSFPEFVRTFRAIYNKLHHAPGFHFLRFYLAGILQDICSWPRTVTPDAPDPYEIAFYLRTVHDNTSESTSHDSAR